MKRYLFYKAFIVSLFSQLVSAGVSDTPLFLSDNIAPNPRQALSHGRCWRCDGRGAATGRVS